MQLRFILLLPLALSVFFIGCKPKKQDARSNESSAAWDVTYFDLASENQPVSNKPSTGSSVVLGRIETSEIRLRPMDDNGMPLPCITFREGQFIEQESGRTFPIRVGSRAGLFDVLENANGTTVRLHVIEKTIDDSFAISHFNVIAIERSQ